MFQWSDDYNAKTIFDQVWEAPYEWFYLIKFNDPNIYDNHEGSCLEVVLEVGGDNRGISKTHVTAEMIDDAVIPTYKEYMNLPSDHPDCRSFAHWIEDLDANDVDLILQRAIFGEI